MTTNPQRPDAQAIVRFEHSGLVYVRPVGRGVILGDANGDDLVERIEQLVGYRDGFYQMRITVEVLAPDWTTGRGSRTGFKSRSARVSSTRRNFSVSAARPTPPAARSARPSLLLPSTQAPASRGSQGMPHFGYRTRI